MNNRLDIFDERDKRWREAQVVDRKANRIKIHYKSYSSVYDEILDLKENSSRIKEVGSLSGAEGWAKYSLKH
jgi:hypothetical protein